MTRYVVYDVFTDTPFGGNQLAVFPQADDLPQDRLQAIAREFNFSEVTFVYPPEDKTQTARVRIFTPTSEIPFAGHPVIGTATALHDDGAPAEMILSLGVGPITCRIAAGEARFVTEVPLEVCATPDPDLVARAVSLKETQIKLATHPPTLAGLGLPFVIVELVDRAALAAALPDMQAFREGARRYPTGLDFAVFCYIREGDRVAARMFAPLDNIPEDPATGSACAALAALLRDKEPTLHIRQGEDMGRPSLIRTTALPHGIEVAGKAVKIMEGRLCV